jgi:hypothetical protein
MRHLKIEVNNYDKEEHRYPNFPTGSFVDRIACMW